MLLCICRTWWVEGWKSYDKAYLETALLLQGYSINAPLALKIYNLSIVTVK
jgi:hypothetical protein